MFRSTRFALISVLGTLAGCFLGGQSGDPTADASSPPCVPREIEWDEVLPIENVSARQLVEQRRLTTSAAYWFETSAMEPPGGFEPEAASRVGQVSVALSPDLERRANVCYGDIEIPVVVAITSDDGIVQEFGAVLHDQLLPAAVERAEPNIATLLPPDAEEWPAVGACRPYYEYEAELSRGRLCLDELQVRWPVACQGWTQTPLGTPGASQVGSVAPLLAEAGTRELRAAGLPALRLTLSSMDPTQCDLFDSYSFGAGLVAQTSGIEETFSTTFHASRLDESERAIRIISGPDYCFDVAGSEEWVAIAARDGAEAALCIHWVAYSWEGSAQIQLSAEVSLTGSTEGWIYE